MKGEKKEEEKKSNPINAPFLQKLVLEVGGSINRLVVVIVRCCVVR